MTGGADPYLLPNGTLKNKLGLADADELQKAEDRITAARGALLNLDLPGPPFGFGTLQAMHHALFQDLYNWAGQPRTTVLAKREYDHPASPVQRFTAPEIVVAEAEPVFRRLANQAFLAGTTRAAFAQGAAETLASLNRIHPFREGNGRTQRLLIAALAQHAGHKVAFDVITRERMVAVSVAAHKGDPSGMRRMFDEILDPRQVGAMRTALGFLDRSGFAWNEHYIATTRAGQDYAGVLVGRTASDFMLRADPGRGGTRILIGDTGDLPPDAKSRERISVHASQFPVPGDVPAPLPAAQANPSRRARPKRTRDPSPGS